MSIIRQLHDPISKQLPMTAHRGDWRNNLEKLIPAIESSIGIGVDMVEADLKKSKGGKLILVHNESMNCIRSGHGKPADSFDPILKHE